MRECDRCTHTYGNAADNPSGWRWYPTGMTDAEWAAVRENGRSSSPNGARSASC